LGSNSSTAKKKEMLMRDRKKTVTPQLPSWTHGKVYNSLVEQTDKGERKESNLSL
jgi:hypothetical protein